MAVDMAQSTAEGDVSNCVANLIHAFTNGLNVFKRLKERRKKKKSRVKSKAESEEKREEEREAELQLSSSLRRGPVELREKYEMCYGEKGDGFAKGDAIAHASLAETLIRLNTGLVGIIATFLNHGERDRHLNLDYRSLTSLSDVSRREALGSLNQLYSRLSQSQLQLHRAPHSRPNSHQRKTSASRQKASGPTVAKVPIKNSSHTQLVFVRPKGTRKGTSSSGSSTKSHSTAVNSPYVSPLGSPLPQYAPKDPFPPQKAPPNISRGNASAARRRAECFDGPRPTTWPYNEPHDTVPHALPSSPPPKLSPARKSPPPPGRKHTPVLENKYTPSSTPVPKRRLDKATPSTYTFASDSTKLGEIPQRNWTQPWNYDEAERLNAEAAVMPIMVAGEVKKAKKGFFGFLKRGSAQAA